MDQQTRNTIIKQLEINNKLFKIGDLFYQNGIPYSVLKGCHLAYCYYDSPEKRPYVDLDILIEPANLFSALDLLSQNFTTNNLFFQNKDSLIKNQYNLQINIEGIILELHWALAPCNKYKIDINDYLKHTEKIDINGHQLYGLEPTYLLASLLIHAAKSYIYPLDYKYYNDIEFLLKKRQIDISQLKKLLTNANCLTAAIIFLTRLENKKLVEPILFSLNNSSLINFKRAIFTLLSSSNKITTLTEHNLFIKQILFAPLLSDSFYLLLSSFFKYLTLKF